MKRSRGVTILGVVFLLRGAALMYQAIFTPVQVLQVEQRAAANPEIQQALANLKKQLSEQEPIFLVVTGVLWLVSGIGVLMLKNWARLLTLIHAGGLVVCTPSSFFITTNKIWNAWPRDSAILMWTKTMIWISLVIGMVLNGFILWYFLRPSVKAQFQRNEGAQA